MEANMILLAKNVMEILEGIFSEQPTAEQSELIEEVFCRAFTRISSSNDAFMAMEIFYNYMEGLLVLLMDGYGEEE